MNSIVLSEGATEILVTVHKNIKGVPDKFVFEVRYLADDLSGMRLEVPIIHEFASKSK